VTSHRHAMGLLAPKL